GQSRTGRRNWPISATMPGTSLALLPSRSIVAVGRMGEVNRVVKTAGVVLLLASFVGLQPVPAEAHGKNHRDRREDRYDRREDRWDRRDDRWDRRDDRNGYWDPSQYYRRDDRRYGSR